MFKISILGIAHGLPTNGATILAKCHCAFASDHMQNLLVDFAGTVHNLSPLSEALTKITEEAEHGDIAILASGDPLFFGIGRTLINKFGTERISIHPGLSAVQLACARFKEPWDDATFISLHGREIQNFATRILQHPKVIIFTDSKHSPTMIAKALIDTLEKVDVPQDTVQIMVAENLDMTDERLISGSPSMIANQEFSALNMVIIKQLRGIIPAPVFSLGLHEGDIIHSRGLITKDEVRAATIHKLRLPQTGVFWDIGAGSGSISIEAARLLPGLEIFAIEQHPEEQENIQRNIQHFKLANITLIKGQAPESLAALPHPDRVFIGGSGGKLAAIIDYAAPRLSRHGGVLTLNAVTAATREAAPTLLHAQGLQVELSTIQVSRCSFPSTGEDVINFKPITIITGRK